MNIPVFNLNTMYKIFAQQERLGTVYGYGRKPPTLTAEPRLIHSIDCSGEFRYLAFKATGGALVLPDGSQNQREWLETSGAHQLNRYEDVLYSNPNRLFAGTIRPHYNGCGDVGHIWYIISRYPGAIPTTLESHGGGGCTSRAWNYPTLLRECYAVFELPCISGAVE